MNRNCSRREVDPEAKANVPIHHKKQILTRGLMSQLTTSKILQMSTKYCVLLLRHLTP
mgnify:CR=1 FL=1